MDIEPNIDYELQRFARSNQTQVRFDKDARQHYLAFGRSPQAIWRGNFRELGSSIARMATLAEQGRINQPLVDEEIARLKSHWQGNTTAQLPAKLAAFEQSQLETVLKVCRASTSLSEAGRQVFAVSRQQKKQPHDADRLHKYLARFGLSWDSLR